MPAPAPAPVFAPVSMELYGSLQDVLLTKGYLEVFDERPVPRRVQFVRFACGEPRLARLVRVEIETPQGKRSFTPSGASECLNLCFDVPPCQRITARLIRGRHVDPAALDDPFPSVFVALELLG